MVDLYNTCFHASLTRWPPMGISPSFMDSRGSLKLLWNEPGHIFILRLANIFRKGQIISVSGSAGHVVSVTTTQLCHCSTETAIDTQEVTSATGFQ